jgi:hypothetical protein
LGDCVVSYSRIQNWKFTLSKAELWHWWMPSRPLKSYCDRNTMQYNTCKGKKISYAIRLRCLIIFVSSCHVRFYLIWDFRIVY